MRNIHVKLHASFKEKVYGRTHDGRTDGRRPIAIAYIVPLAQIS